MHSNPPRRINHSVISLFTGITGMLSLDLRDSSENFVDPDSILDYSIAAFSSSRLTPQATTTDDWHWLLIMLTHLCTQPC
jgi:hypothetical protein